MEKTRTVYYPLGGGLDLVTPALSMRPSKALALVNFEPFYNGGYRRIDGFEKFDGRPKPSEQSFVGFEVSAVEDLSVGGTVTGSISGASGTIIGIYEDDGTRGNDMLGVTKITGGPFVENDILTTVTNADEDVRPDTGNAIDTGNVLLDPSLSNIDEGVDFADGLVMETIRNEWSGGPIVEIPLTDLPAHVTTINSWTLRVRARVIRKGDSVIRNGGGYVESPESDDLVAYQFEFLPDLTSKNVEFTDVDAGLGFITRTATLAVATATPAQFNATTILFTQTNFGQFGDLFDGLTLEIDAIDVVVDYDGDVKILSAPVTRDAVDQTTEDEFLLAAQEEYRDDIAVVPGSGSVRMAWHLGSAAYAIRDNAGATAGVLHVASAAGWVTAGVTMAEYIAFTAGLAAGSTVVEGDTLTGGTSGATATIHRIVLNGGSNAWDGSGEGYFVLTNVAGGPFQNGESLESPALTAIATANGINTTLAFSVGGKYEMVNHNFFAGADTLRAYGCNGVDNFAFEIDENGVVSPIFMPNNAVVGTEVVPSSPPFLIEEHRNYLYLGFVGGRYINSVIGEPLRYTGFLGSAEFGAGDELTGLVSVVGSVLVVLTERETRGLFGFDSLDWEFKLLSEKSGSRVYGAQKIDTVYSLDDLGVSSLARTDTFGDFVGSTVSQLVQPLVLQLLDSFTVSTIVRSSNQYRIYFTDGSGLIMYVPAVGSFNRDRMPSEQTRTRVQFGVLQYPFAVSRMWNTEDGDGTEISYFISDDTGASLGYVFQDRIGGNFDGEGIQAFLRTAFNFMKTPAIRKRFRRVDMELDAQKPLTLKFTADLSAGVSDSENVQASPDISVNAGGGFWNIDNWDELFWDGQAISSARANIRGSGEAVGFVIFNDSASARPFILQGLTVHYEQRRLQR